MKPDQLIFWLSGFLENKDRDLTQEETLIIKNKLESCFNKVTPLNNNTDWKLLYGNSINFPEIKQPITC